MNASPSPDTANESAELPPEAIDPATAEQPTELDTVKADLEKFRDIALRTQADLDNYRKRAVREREESVRYANASLLEKLLPILDNFDLGLDAARQSGDAGGILAGMSMVQKQLHDFLREQGVDVIDALGNPFDPNLHEAIGQEASAEVAEGSVIRQLRRGYKLKDRLLRPATVIVAKAAE